MCRVPSLVVCVALFVSACCSDQSASANTTETREPADVDRAETLGAGGDAGTFPLTTSAGCRLKDVTFVTIDAWPLSLSNGIVGGCHYQLHEAP